MFCLRNSQVRALLACIVILIATPMAGAQTGRNSKLSLNVQKKVFKKGTTIRPSAENDVVFRVQLRLKTANRKNAGTDDPVKVRINGAQGTWIDSASDDHERGRSYLYDLMLENSSSQGMRLRDITQLEISKTGSDGWNIESLELIVNNGVIFQKSFPGGQWLDNSKGKQRKLTISSRTLRSHSKWRRFKSPIPSPVIKQAELEKRIESIIGHYIHSDKRVQWGKLSGRGVEVTYKNAQTVHVDLDLKADINNFPDAAIDVDFDIRITARQGAIDLKMLNFKVRVASKLHQALLGVNGFFGGTSRTQLQNSINKQIERNINGLASSVSTGKFNVSVSVKPGGNIVVLPKH